MSDKKFIDHFSGSRYGKRNPIGKAEGTELYNKFIESPRWELLSRTPHHDEKKDNRMDIYRGATSIFKDVRNGKKVKINEYHSNTGKTIKWLFSYVI